MLKLSGPAIDTLHSLFWHGPREAGDIPSKVGESELASYGLCRRVNVEKTPGLLGNHLCMLTPDGYNMALKLCVKEQ